MNQTPKYDWDNDAFDEACRLVGRFMHHWALLEGTMDAGVSRLLGMSSLEGAIATNNMQCRNKIHILKTLIDLFGGKQDWGKAAIKTMTAIGDMADKRNTVAHVTFTPHKEGVEFLPTKARGKLAFPTVVWTVADFDARSDEMEALWNELDRTVEKMAVMRRAMGVATSAPNRAPDGPGLLNALSRLLEGNPDSPPANPPTGD